MNEEVDLDKEKRIFDDDVNACTLEMDHLMEDITDSRLKEIDDLFGKADAVSRENDVKTNRQRLLIAVCGVIVTFFFMFYGEGELNFLLSSLSFMLIIVIYVTVRNNNNNNRHAKHLKYRVIAESLRAQFFISYVGIDINVFEMLPWAIRDEIPVIKKLLQDLPGLTSEGTKNYYPFCRGERKYHEKSIKDYDGHFNDQYNLIINFTKTITFFSFAAAFLFDSYILLASPVGVDLNLIYFVIKMMMGLATMISLLMDELFGKMSLDTKVDDHKRMLKMYEEECREIFLEKDKAKAEERYTALIREFLINASTKYVYLKKNNIEFILF